MKLEELTIAQIRDAQEYCNKNIKTVGEWKTYWASFRDKHGLTTKEALKIAQNRF